MKTLLATLLLSLATLPALADSNVVRCRSIDVTYLPFYNVELQVLATQSMGDTVRMKVSIDKKVRLGGLNGRIYTIHQDLFAVLPGPTSRKISLYGENESGRHKVGAIRLGQNLVKLRNAYLKMEGDEEEELFCQ